MHALVESYLQDLESHLDSLPPKQRVEDLLEMREHLQNALKECVDRGESEEEAARSVVTQFGTPEAIGQETVEAWQRGERLKKRTIAAVALFAFMATPLSGYLNRSVILPHLESMTLHQGLVAKDAAHVWN